MRCDCAKELGLAPFYQSLGYAVEREVPGQYYGRNGVRKGRASIRLATVDMKKDTAMSDIRVVRRDQRDAATAQTPGMTRVAGVAASTCGASGIWMGEVDERARLPLRRAPSRRRRERDLRPQRPLPHALGRPPRAQRRRRRRRLHLRPGATSSTRRSTLSQTEPLVAIVARGGQENVVVNVEIPEAER